jgi:ADP-ribose pyrophosphatase YjhB (NUDIX family)
MIEFFIKKQRKFVAEWLPRPFTPPRELTIQSSGVCFTKDGKITLVGHGTGWLLPGGYPEKHETLEEALIREIAEEACARVLDLEYLGSIKCRELPPLKEGNPPLFYQARYWALVENGDFVQAHEITERTEIEPASFVEKIQWPAKRLAELILGDALTANQNHHTTDSAPFSERPSH